MFIKIESLKTQPFAETNSSQQQKNSAYCDSASSSQSISWVKPWGSWEVFYKTKGLEVSPSPNLPTPPNLHLGDPGMFLHLVGSKVFSWYFKV